MDWSAISCSNGVTPLAVFRRLAKNNMNKQNQVLCELRVVNECAMFGIYRIKMMFHLWKWMRMKSLSKGYDKYIVSKSSNPMTKHINASRIRWFHLAVDDPLSLSTIKRMGAKTTTACTDWPAACTDRVDAFIVLVNYKSCMEYTNPKVNPIVLLEAI